MPSATQNKFLAKTTGEKSEELPQTKREVSEPGVQYEQEADRMAGRVVGDRGQTPRTQTITPRRQAHSVHLRLEHPR